MKRKKVIVVSIITHPRFIYGTNISLISCMAKNYFYKVNTVSCKYVGVIMVNIIKSGITISYHSQLMCTNKDWKKFLYKFYC